MTDVTDRLLSEGVQLFSDAFAKLLKAVERQSRDAGAGGINRLTHTLPAPMAAAVRDALAEWRVQGKVRRLWGRDASLWTGKDEAQGLGWLGVTNGQLAHIQRLTDEKNAPGLTGALNGEPTLAAYLAGHLNRLGSGDYLALLAYIEMNEAHEQALQAMRLAVRDAKRVATCLEFGPRFLHSTGQAYKGGPNTGVFLQITCSDAFDVPVPGEKYTCAVVKAAQARGDFRFWRSGTAAPYACIWTRTLPLGSGHCSVHPRRTGRPEAVSVADPALIGDTIDPIGPRIVARRPPSCSPRTGSCGGIPRRWSACSPRTT